jgi:uncharacterized membrane protein YhaH (DUF805 family)
MNFGKSISDSYKGYVVFKGRTSRSGYWLAFLFYAVISLVISAVEGQTVNASTGMTQRGPLSSAWSLINLLPLIAIGVRRMHDNGKSGWFLLIPIYDIVLLATAGKPEDNEYGSQAK